MKKPIIFYLFIFIFWGVDITGCGNDTVSPMPGATVSKVPSNTVSTAPDITNKFGPYLYPNQYVNFADSVTAIWQSEELAKTADSDLDVVTNVYNYMISNFTYNYKKADSVVSEYLPDVDAALASKKASVSIMRR